MHPPEPAKASSRHDLSECLDIRVQPSVVKDPEHERELIQERIRSGIAVAKAGGKKLGRQPGQRPKSDRLVSKVLTLVAQGRSYRLIGREVGLSKNTVAEIVRRSRATP